MNKIIFRLFWLTARALTLMMRYMLMLRYPDAHSPKDFTDLFAEISDYVTRIETVATHECGLAQHDAATPHANEITLMQARERRRGA